MRSTLAILGISIVIFIGCTKTTDTTSKPEMSPEESILGGEHRLRKLVEFTGQNASMSGSMFFLVGDVTGHAANVTSLKFAWEINDGTYAISSLPIEKIRVKLDDSAAVPTIKFRWVKWNSFRERYNHPPQIQDYMDDIVLYAVITIKEKNWPIQVNPPMNTP